MPTIIYYGYVLRNSDLRGLGFGSDEYSLSSGKCCYADVVHHLLDMRALIPTLSQCSGLTLPRRDFPLIQNPD